MVFPVGKATRTVRAELALRAGRAAAWLSQQVGAGGGSIIGGRVALGLDPTVLSRLAKGRRVVLVSGTNGKTTTSHLLAGALRSAGPVAHNASGSNMPDGAVAALARDRDASMAVIEVDELHLAQVAEATDPELIVLLNLSRDQLDRGAEVRSVAEALSAPLSRRPHVSVVANADDPIIVWAAAPAHRVVWVSTAASWSGDAGTCPQCGRFLDTSEPRWHCPCGLTRPAVTWTARDGAAHTSGRRIEAPLQLPGRFNLGNAVMAIAAAAQLGIDPAVAAATMADVEQVAGRYQVVQYGRHEIRLLLAKNPAGWTETLDVIDHAKALLVVVNAREADGRDTSWLWDVAFETLRSEPVVASGERAADVGLRLSYAEVAHTTVDDPVAALDTLPPGKVDIVANYTAFQALRRHLDTTIRTPRPQ